MISLYDNRTGKRIRTEDRLASAATDGILIVDDNAAVVELLMRLLEKHGISTATAVDAAEARRKISTARDAGRPFQMVISDVNMPGASGVDLLRWIQSAHPQTSTLLISGDELEYDESDALRPELDDFCKKPYSLQEIIHKIEELGRRRHRFLATVSGNSCHG